MKEKSTLTGKIKNCAIPGLITLGVVIFTLIFKGIWPFGSNRIDYFDNMQQVAPLYAHLWDWMHGNASIWFDWYTGLGTNVSMSISAFTMLSPFNLLLYLIPRNLILESISILTALKMVCMSVTMYIYLDSKFSRLQDCLKTIFAVMFSLSGYVILYGSCFTPWMDVVAVFPLLMLAFENMMKQGKKLFYIIMLALMFIMNYYLGAMSLIYIFMLSGIYILTSEQKKKWKHQIWDLGIGTVAGMGLSCFVLIPVMMQLSSSQRGSSGTSLLDQYKGWITSAIISDGTMAAFQRWMMFFGLSFVIAIIVAGVRKYWGIERRKTITMLLTTALVVIPVIVQGTNLMWHFGSYNGYTLRNGYLISFTLICVAAGMAEKMFADIPLKGAFYRRQTAVVAVIGAVYVMVYNILPINNEMLAMAFFIMIFAVMFAVYMFMLIRKKEFNCKSVILVIALELFIGAYALIGPPKFYTYEDYQIGDYVQYANDAADSLDIEESATDRIVNPDISLNANYPLILRRGALSSFTAALEDDTQSYAKRWGYSKYFLWLLDSGGTVFSNAVLHVTQAVNINELDRALYTLEKKEGDYSLYNTNYNLPFGFCVDSSFSKLDMTNVDWITYHNRMYKAMTGDKETFVTRIYPQAETAGNIKSMTINVGSRSAIYMNIADVKKSNADANASKLESSIHVYVNGEAVVVPTLGDVNNTAYFTDYNNNLLYLGIFENEDVQIKIEYDKPKYMNQSKMTIGLLNMEKMDKLCENFADKQTDVSYTNNTLTVKINSDGTKDYALIPVIKSANWTVTLDGKTVKTKEIAGLFTGVQVHEGENTLVFTFVPKGRNAGLLITLVTLLIIVACLVTNHIRTINVPVWAKYCAQYIYVGLFAIVVAAMFVVPAISTIPAAIYHIIRIILK